MVHSLVLDSKSNKARFPPCRRTFSSERDDEILLRDYKIRESRRASQQDRDDANLEYYTRIRRRESEQEFARARQSAQRLNLELERCPSSSARYQSKTELQTAYRTALANESTHRSRAQSLQSELNLEKDRSKYLSWKTDHLALEAARSYERTDRLARVAALRSAIRSLHGVPPLGLPFSLNDDLSQLSYAELIQRQLQIEEELSRLRQPLRRSPFMYTT